MMKLANPLSRSASASQLISLLLTRTFVGAGGGVVSPTAVSLTYCIHALAIDSFGSQPACNGSPANFAAGTASSAVTFASHVSAVDIAVSALPPSLGNRADRQASNHGMAK